MTYKFTLTALVLALAMTACAPRTQSTPNARPPTTQGQQGQRGQQQPGAPTRPNAAPGGNRALTDPAALEVDRAARQAFHLMGLGYARTGTYSVNALVSDLELPSGARWELEDLKPETYRLRFTSDSVPGVAWFVTPEGVKAQQTNDDQIL